MRKKVTFQGKEYTGEVIEFRVASDGPVTLELDDGARLNLRPVVLSVIRTDDRNEDGDRVYVVQTVNHLITLRAAKDDVEP